MGKTHLLKAKERAAQLRKILKEENLSAEERKITEAVLQDLDNAINGK